MKNLLIVLAAMVCAGCWPKYTREPCGTPGAHTCTNDQPHHCIGANPPGWMPIGDEPCSRSGQHCMVTNGLSHCAPGLVDGGAQ